MKDVIRSEWIKLRSVRSNIVVLAVIVLLSLGICVLAASLAGESEFGAQASDPLLVVLPGVGISSVLVGVVGAQVMGQELRFNTLRATLAAVPRRGQVLAAKAVVAVLATVVTIGTMVLVCLATASLIASARGLSIDYGRDGVLGAIVGTVLLCVLYGLVGLGLATLLRNAVLAIVVVIVWPIVIEPLVGALLGLAVDDIGRWFPFTAGNAMATVDPVEGSLGPVTGGLVFAGFTAAVLLAGWFALRHRDA